jgi:alcohol dehydrogenase class IV
MAKDIAFEMAVSSVRFGVGVTREVGMDLKDLGAVSALVVTDPVLSLMRPVQIVMESLRDNGVGAASTIASASSRATSRFSMRSRSRARDSTTRLSPSAAARRSTPRRP